MLERLLRQAWPKGWHFFFPVLHLRLQPSRLAELLESIHVQRLLVLMLVGFLLFFVWLTWSRETLYNAFVTLCELCRFFEDSWLECTLKWNFVLLLIFESHTFFVALHRSFTAIIKTDFECMKFELVGIILTVFLFRNHLFLLVLVFARYLIQQTLRSCLTASQIRWRVLPLTFGR